MLFPSYKETKVLYHVVDIIHLKSVLSNGIKINERNKYSDEKYDEFNKYLDKNKSEKIPPWVKREKAFFASLNFKKNTKWHSHSALLAIRIQEEKCWIANENLANEIYDPFVLQDIDKFNNAKKYMKKYGVKSALKYWEHSFSFREYFDLGIDKRENYDEEVMIFHDIYPQDLNCLMIVTDHNIYTPKQWQKKYISQGLSL